MKTIGILPLSFVAGLAFTLGCSTQYREAYPQITSEELYETFEDIQQNVSDPTVNSFSVNILAEDNSAVMYHVSDSPGRPAVGVLSFVDMSVIHEFWDVGTPSTAIGLAEVDVIFLDQVRSDGSRVFSLLMKLRGYGDETVYFSASSQPGNHQFTEDSFQVTMQSPSGAQILIKSNDLSQSYNEELADAIKLNVYVLENGQEYYAGQVSTMAGFGNR